MESLHDRLIRALRARGVAEPTTITEKLPYNQTVFRRPGTDYYYYVSQSGNFRTGTSWQASLPDPSLRRALLKEAKPPHPRKGRINAQAILG